MTLTGYTDQLGDAATNKALSLKRAQAVRDYLQTHGFPNQPIKVEGRGADNPIKPPSDCAGRDQISCLAPNRRVVFNFNGQK